MSAPRLDYHALAPEAARAGAQFSHALAARWTSGCANW